MGNTTGNLVEPKASLNQMPSPINGHNPDFSFAFEDSNFSDRILRLEIDAGCSEEDEAANISDSYISDDAPTVTRVKTLHISSPILAEKSPFFYKLFSNGMMESEQRLVSLRINNSEEAAFMELLSFMYSNTLTSKTTSELLDVLTIADKFEVTSCMTHCSQLLKVLPMTTESALLYLDIPSSIRMCDAVKHLSDVAKEFLVNRYKEISKFQDEVMNLPLIGLEAILSNNDLNISEDDVCDLVVKWTRAHYQTPKEQREIISSRLGPNIRFSYVTCEKLRKILTSNDFDPEFATKSVLDALFLKVEESDKLTSTKCCYRGQANNKYCPIKIFRFEHRHQECVVYLDLKRAECARLFSSGTVISQAFDMMGQYFYFSVNCNMAKPNPYKCFGFYLEMAKKQLGTFDVEYEYSARTKPTEKYISRKKGNHTFTEGTSWGCPNLFSMDWDAFMAKDCVYFINDILHLRAELTIKRKDR